MDKKWIGCTIDWSFLEYLKMKGIDPCGEKGEYHTLVTYGPIFKQRIKLLENTVYTRDDHWLLDIHKYQLENLS
jgi:diphthine-ammonia ligase